MTTFLIEGFVMNYAGARLEPEKFCITVDLPDSEEETVEDKLLELFPKMVTYSAKVEPLFFAE